MPETTNQRETTKNEKYLDINLLIPRIAREIAVLDRGLLAELRRGPLSGAGSVAFWKLVAKYEIPIHQAPNWAVLTQAIAILTPKGEIPTSYSAYDPDVSMGRALHQAKFSDLRLARLLSARKGMRLEIIIRACRRLTAEKCNRFDLRTLAKYILFQNVQTDQKIARDFYVYSAQAIQTTKNDEHTNQ